MVVKLAASLNRPGEAPARSTVSSRSTTRGTAIAAQRHLGREAAAPKCGWRNSTAFSSAARRPAVHGAAPTPANAFDVLAVDLGGRVAG